MLPRGEAGGSGEGSSRQRGLASLAAQLPVWDEQPWLSARLAACRRACHQHCSGRNPGELRHMGRGAGEHRQVHLQAPRFQCSVLLYINVQRDILHLPVRSIARRAKYPQSSEQLGMGQNSKAKRLERKAGKGERKGQHVAFPSTPNTASPAPCSACCGSAPSRAAELPAGMLGVN